MFLLGLFEFFGHFVFVFRVGDCTGVAAFEFGLFFADFLIFILVKKRFLVIRIVAIALVGKVVVYRWSFVNGLGFLLGRKNYWLGWCGHI